jgi:hypothetical protein
VAGITPACQWRSLAPWRLIPALHEDTALTLTQSHRASRFAVALLLSTCLSTPALAQYTKSTVTLTGATNDSSASLAGATSLTVTAISPSGTYIAGTYETPGGKTYGWVENTATKAVTAFNKTTAPNAPVVPTAVNDAGVVVGQQGTGAGTGFEFKSATNTYSNPGNPAVPTGITDSGTLTYYAPGSSYDNSYEAVTEQPGVVDVLVSGHLLYDFPIDGPSDLSVNDLGEVAGVYQDGTDLGIFTDTESGGIVNVSFTPIGGSASLGGIDDDGDLVINTDAGASDNLAELLGYSPPPPSDPPVSANEPGTLAIFGTALLFFVWRLRRRIGTPQRA